MTTIRIYPYGPSDSARILKEGLQETFWKYRSYAP